MRCLLILCIVGVVSGCDRPQTPAATQPAPVAAKPPAEQPVVSFEFSADDPIGSFTVVNAGRVVSADFQVDAPTWKSLKPIQMKRVADTLWERVLTRLKQDAESEALKIEADGQTEAAKWSSGGQNLQAQSITIEAQKNADLRRLRVSEDATRKTVRIIDQRTNAILATRTTAGFAATSIP